MFGPSLALVSNSISDISALSGLTSLTDLRLQYNNLISDISVLSGLTSLTFLNLDENLISDISALTGLTSLTLGGNSITDITALSGLTSLTFLTLEYNLISDISAVSGLTSLTKLHLHNNSISDITALSGLTSLTFLHLQSNTALNNIQPLLDNADNGGLGAGDEVTLRSTSVSCDDVAALAAKGVTVTSDCTPAAAATLSVTGVTDPITAGASSDVTVTARDGSGDVATGYTGTVAFTSSDGSATLPVNYTFVDGDAGVHTFTGGVMLATVGEHSVTATDVAVGSITGSQTAITVQAASGNGTFSDDFEGGLGLWSATNGIWVVGLPTSGPNECHSGVQCAGTVLDGNYPVSSSSLVSPTITLPAIGALEEIHLRFWHWFSLGGGTGAFGSSSDLGQVSVQEKLGPGVWSASTLLATYSRGSGGWTSPLVDLSAFGGKAVRILFGLDGNNTTNTGAGSYIDDISVAVVQANNTVPYFDDFEGGLGNWWASNGSWEVGGSFTAGPGSCNNGTGCAGTVLDGNYPINNTSLVSPTITLPAVGLTQEIHLRFWHWFSLGGGTGAFGSSSDLGIVRIQEETAPGDWSASTELTRFQGVSGGWSSPLVDLSAFGGKTVRILFQLDGNNTSNTGPGWYIDDVSIAIN